MTVPWSNETRWIAVICQDEYDGADTGTETIEEEAIVAETDDAELLSGENNNTLCGQ